MKCLMSTISPKTNNSGNKKILNAKALYTTKRMFVAYVISALERRLLLIKNGCFSLAVLGGFQTDPLR